MMGADCEGKSRAYPQTTQGQYELQQTQNP